MTIGLSLFQSSSPYLLIVVIVTLWHIWKAMNNFVFNRLQLDLHAISRQISYDLYQFQLSGIFSNRSSLSTTSLRVSLDLTWHLPLSGVIKLNCGVTWNNKFSLAVVVVIASDSTGTVLFEFTKKFWCSSDGLMVLVKLELFWRVFYGH